jgi:hypothetical protein
MKNMQEHYEGGVVFEAADMFPDQLTRELAHLVPVAHI